MSLGSIGCDRNGSLRNIGCVFEFYRKVIKYSVIAILVENGVYFWAEFLAKILSNTLVEI